MENKSHAFWAGLFTVVLVVAIGIAAFLFNVDRSVREPYDLIARTNVTGLFTDAAVRYRGLDVGKVQSIKFDHDHPGQILIRILVDRNAPITHSTFGSLGFQGVTGIAFIQLDDTGTDPGDEMGQYGLRDTNGRDKPSMAAFRAVAAANGGAGGPCGDFDPPTITILSPTPSQTYDDKLNLQASATDAGVGVARI